MYFDKRLCMFHQIFATQDELFETMFKTMFQAGVVKSDYLEGRLKVPEGLHRSDSSHRCRYATCRANQPAFLYLKQRTHAAELHQVESAIRPDLQCHGTFCAIFQTMHAVLL